MKKFPVSLVIYKNLTEMHGQQNIKKNAYTVLVKELSWDWMTQKKS